MTAVAKAAKKATKKTSKKKTTASKKKTTSTKASSAKPAAKPKSKVPGGTSVAARKRRLASLLERLDKSFGEVQTPELEDVMEHAIYLILREGASHSTAIKALASLRDDFVDWNEVRASTPSELGRMMLGTNRASSLRKMYPRAERIKEMIDQVYNDRNDTDLDFLTELKMKEQIEFLEDLDDLGIHNAYAMVQWMSGDTSKLVAISSEVANVAKMVGLTESAAVTKAKKELGDLCPPERYVALQAHLGQLGDLDEDDWTPSMKEFLA